MNIFIIQFDFSVKQLIIKKISTKQCKLLTINELYCSYVGIFLYICHVINKIHCRYGE